MRKAQADIISAVLIIIMGLAMVGVAYTWGVPLIEKRADTSLVERTYKAFDPITNEKSLPKIIAYISNHGGEDIFSLDTKGIWHLYPANDLTPENNSIQFSFQAKVSNLAVNQGWIPLSSGSTSPIGIQGFDDSYVVFGRADTAPGGYNITYKVWFRGLNNTVSDKVYDLDLVQNTAGPLISSGKTVKISRGDVRTEVNLITTEIKILLG
jgi:hypothetical protein